MTQTESIERFLARLFSQDIRVWAEGDRLRCAGPDSALTQDITADIRSHKADILQFLNSAERTPAASPSPQAIVPHDSPAPPLSFAQQRLWFIEQMLPDTALYHMPFAIEATGTLDEIALEVALKAIVNRHAVLRTRIHTEQGEPRQIVESEPNVPIRRIDRRTNPPDPAEIRALIAGEARQTFDLSQNPPLRLALIKLADDRTLLLFTLHHIAADGTSINVLTGDLAAFYAQALGSDGTPPAPLSIQYGDFAAWQRDQLQGSNLERLLDFWRGHLQGPLPVTQLPTDFIRPPMQDNEGAVHSFTISPKAVSALRRIAREQNATLFAALFTAFNVLVYRYSTQSDLVVGTPVANRRHSETEGMIGLFVNLLAVRTRLLPAAGFCENLQRVQATLWETFEHQDVPFEKLVEDLQPDRDPSLSPLFQIKFQLDPAQEEHIVLPDVELRRLARQDGLARLDLSMDLREVGDGILGDIEYSTALFSAATVSGLAEHFLNLVEAVVAKPAQPVAELALLSSEEKSQRLSDWNDTKSDYDRASGFPQMFEAQAAQSPDAIALVHAADGNIQTWTYQELNHRANQLAHHLRKEGVGPEVMVGIALERGLEMIAAWLAVLKAGGAYLPLDPAYPVDRIAYMLEDSGAELVLSQSTITLPRGKRRLDLDTNWPDDASTDNPVSNIRPDHLAYIIYTSGSTGRPKGVLVPHGGLVNLTADKIRVCDVRPGDCVLQFFSFSFDASIPELVMSLAAGARLLVAPANDLLPGPDLTRLLREQAVTHITMTPSALLSLPTGEYPDLRLVLVGGEAPSPELIERWSQRRTFINAYGPTETTVNASMVRCGNGAPSEPTLWPAANKQLYVLDDNLEMLPVGVPGELYIGGAGLARGYHGRADLTATQFVPDPFTPRAGGAGVLYRTGDRACHSPDGRIRLLGRMDHQVKIRGYRIEPGEIEAALLNHVDVASAVIAVREDNAGDRRLVAYAVPRETEHAPGSTVRAFLRNKLPRFLVPDAFVWLDAIPLTVNGKVDTGLLPAPEHALDRSTRLPSGSTEIELAGLFQGVLGVSEVFAEDDFFELGGHSLLATQLVAAVLEKFDVELSVLDLFNGPTVSGLAARIEDRRSGTSATALDPDYDDAWKHDVSLEAAIHPAATVVVPERPRRILLTGATGFVGAYLLSELLRDPETEVFCLLRGEPVIGRLQSVLAGYGLWDQSLTPRVHPLSGDLSQTGLGLNPAQYDKLTSTVDAVFHNGAEVNHLLPYEHLRAANVDGTREVLRLACAGPGRPLHYISSLSVLPVAALPDRPRFYEHDTLADYPAPLGGYNRSKWVAEQLVSEAGKRGLPVAIFRPGPITGDSRNGAFNPADILCRLVQGYIQSGMAPQGSVQLDMLPIDYFARAVIHLANQPDSVGRTFHMIHSSHVSSDLLFEACVAEGFPVRRVPYSVWRKALMDIARGDTEHPLYPLVVLFAPRESDDAEVHVDRELPFDCSVSRAALAASPFKEPALDLSLFQIYLRAFVSAGVISATTTGGPS